MDICTLSWVWLGVLFLAGPITGYVVSYIILSGKRFESINRFAEAAIHLAVIVFFIWIELNLWIFLQGSYCA